MINRNKHFEKKYIKATKNDFFLYTYSVITKANIDAEIIRKINKFKLKRLHIPSNFVLEKTQKVQGPRICIIYGSNINIAKIQSIQSFKHLGLKLNNLTYSCNLVKSALLYITPLKVCIKFNTILHHNLSKFILYSKYNINNKRSS